jgi:hypothetical protein
LHGGRLALTNNGSSKSWCGAYEADCSVEDIWYTYRNSFARSAS